MSEPDYTVKIVSDNPDAEVSVVGNQIIEATPADVGKVVTVAADGSLVLAEAEGGGGEPSGPAGGDLTGTYPDPTIALLAVTDAKVATANKDGTAGTASMRTLGTGAAQAAAGDHAHSGTYVPLSVVDAADDLIVGSGADAVTRLAVAASRIIGKKASGGLAALTGAEVLAITGVNDLLPRMVEILPQTPVTNTNWNSLANDSRYYGAYALDSSGAQNAELTLNIALAAGTWDLELMSKRNVAWGIITFSLNGTDVGTLDLYNGSEVFLHRQTLTGIVVATGGLQVLRLRMATKNASASSYTGQFQKMTFKRTA